MAHLDKAVRRRMASPTDDALSRLIEGEDEEGNRLSFQEVKDQSLFLLLAGHDTLPFPFVGLVRCF